MYFSIFLNAAHPPGKSWAVENSFVEFFGVHTLFVDFNKITKNDFENTKVSWTFVEFFGAFDAHMHAKPKKASFFALPSAQRSWRVANFVKFN